jgi:hypothetical protein
MADLQQELLRATRLHPPYASAHEGFAVLLEEVDELKAHVWARRENRDMRAMRAESIQVAAVAIRFAAELCGDEHRGGLRGEIASAALGDLATIDETPREIDGFDFPITTTDAIAALRAAVDDAESKVRAVDMMATALAEWPAGTAMRITHCRQLGSFSVAASEGGAEAPTLELAMIAASLLRPGQCALVDLDGQAVCATCRGEGIPCSYCDGTRRDDPDPPAAWVGGVPSAFTELKRVPSHEVQRELDKYEEAILGTGYAQAVDETAQLLRELGVDVPDDADWPEEIASACAAALGLVELEIEVSERTACTRCVDRSLQRHACTHCCDGLEPTP